MQQQDFEKHLANATARGIAEEKTRESLAVFKVIGAVMLSWVVGSVTDSPQIGVVVMLVLFALVWKSYHR